MPVTKLVRDKIPEILERENKKYRIIKHLEGDELIKELIQKLYEEIKEFEQTKNIEELADILEVIDGLAYALGTNFNKVLEIKAKKQKERGGFYRGILIEIDSNKK